MKFAVIQFPGSNCDQDCIYTLREVLDQSARLLWHTETTLGPADAVIIPGGFSYGDYLRTGAIARFSPVMTAVQSFASAGGLVFGVCNGFQILCEAGLLPGALIRNRSLQFRCEDVFLKTVHHESPFTASIPPGRLLRIPIAHGEGCYFAEPATVASLFEHRQVLWQYATAGGEPSEGANPNGSVGSIAGICNRRGNVGALMPHPDRACDKLLGSRDGLFIFESVIHALEKGHFGAAA